MTAFAQAAAVVAQLPAGDPAALEVARGTVAGLLAGSVRGTAVVWALAVEDRRRQWGESDADAARTVDAVLGIEPAPAWPDAPHLPGPPEPTPLPLDVLPPVLRTHVASVADATQTPPDLGLLLALAAISAAAGSRVEVAVDGRGWREPGNVYGVVILPPATRKSPVFSAMTLPLVAWEREQAEEMGPSYRRARDRADVAEAALAATKAAAAKGKATLDEVEAARVDADAALAAVPVLPRLLASDATPEALVRIMAEQGGRIALMAPEADPLNIADGRYGDGVARMDELLRAWSAEPIRVDRIGREPIHVERPALTLGLTLQPAVLDQLRNARAMRGRGLLGRILWSLPPHGLGTRCTGADVPPLDQMAAERYDRLLRTLLFAGTAGADPLVVLTLDPDALAVLYDYEAAVELELADGGRLAGIRDWAGKVVGQSVRLAALLELAGRAEDGRPLYGEPIGRWAMEGGVRLARALETHAGAVLAEMGMDARTMDARYVLRRARDLPIGSTLSDLRDATRDRPGLATIDDLRPVVEGLVERGCLRLVEQTREGPGRPRSPVVELHPSLNRQTPDRPPVNSENPGADTLSGNIRGLRGAYPGSGPETEVAVPPVAFDDAEDAA